MSLQLISPTGIGLDLFPKTVVQMNFKNSVFNSNVLEGSYSYAFAIPLSDTNRIYFGFPERVSSLQGYETVYSGFKLKDGLVEILCKLVVRSVQGGININLFSASGALADKLRDTKLNEITTQTIDVQQEFYYIKSRFTIDPGTDYAIASGTVKWALTGGGFYSHRYGVLFNTGDTEADVVKRLADRINAASQPVLVWNAATTYLTDQLVLNIAETEVYASNDDGNLNNATSDGTKWTYLCDKADFNTVRAAAGTALWYEYDDFDYVKRERAFSIDDYIIIYDTLKGTAGKILDVNTLNAPEDESDVGYFNLYEFAAYGSNVWQDNFTALAGYMTAHVLKDGANPDFTFFPIHNPQFSPDPDYCGVVNYWKDGAFRGNIIRENPYQYAFSAQVNFIYALQKMHTHLSQEVEDNGLFSDSFLKTLYLLNNYSNDRNLRGFDAGGFYYIDAGANIIDISKNLPPISFADFLNGFRGYFFLGVWFDWFTGKVIYKTLKDLLTEFSEAVDITGLVSNMKEISYTDQDGFTTMYSHDGGDAFINENVKNIYDDAFTIITAVATFASLIASPDENDLCLVIDEDNWYVAVLLFEGVVEWQFYSKNLYGVKIANGKTSYQPKCATPLMYTGHDFARGPRYTPPVFVRSEENTYRQGDVVQDNNGDYYICQTDHKDKALSNVGYWQPLTQYKWRVPMTAQARSSRNFKEKSGCTLRLVSYAGVVQNPTGADPLDVYPFATNDRGATGSLKWNGTYGIYEQRGKEWFDFLANTKKALATLPMSEELLQKLKPWKQVKVENNFYLLGEIKASFPFNSALAEITLYSISYGS
jgi:hypothetical protein